MSFPPPHKRTCEESWGSADPHFWKMKWGVSSFPSSPARPGWSHYGWPKLRFKREYRSYDGAWKDLVPASSRSYYCARFLYRRKEVKGTLIISSGVSSARHDFLLSAREYGGKSAPDAKVSMLRQPFLVPNIHRKIMNHEIPVYMTSLECDVYGGRTKGREC